MSAAEHNHICERSNEARKRLYDNEYCHIEPCARARYGTLTNTPHNTNVRIGAMEGKGEQGNTKERESSSVNYSNNAMTHMRVCNGSKVKKIKIPRALVCFANAQERLPEMVSANGEHVSALPEYASMNEADKIIGKEHVNGKVKNGISHLTIATNNTRKTDKLKFVESGEHIKSALTQGQCKVHTCFCERVGNEFHPMSCVRTGYQQSEMCKRHVHTRQVHEQPLRNIEVIIEACNVNVSDNIDASNHQYVNNVNCSNRLNCATTPNTYYSLIDFDLNEANTDASFVKCLSENDSKNDMHARSRYYNHATKCTEWNPCTVRTFDLNKLLWQIEWSNGKRKWTTRLNILFDDESITQWRCRVRAADRYRSETESNERELLYLNAIPDNIFTQITTEQIDRILSHVAERFPLNLLHIVRHHTDKIEAIYSRGVRRGVFWFNMLMPEEQKRLSPCHLPLPFFTQSFGSKPSLADLRGTVDVPSPNYSNAKRFLENNLFHAHALLYDTLHAIHVTWDNYENRLFCYCLKEEFSSSPIALEQFVTLQKERGVSVAEKLHGEWCANVHSTIQNTLDPYFNFYEDNKARFTVSRMCRFISLVNVMMNSQLRNLLERSLQQFVEFIEKYSVIRNEREVEYEQLPIDVEENNYWAEKMNSVRIVLREKDEDVGEEVSTQKSTATNDRNANAAHRREKEEESKSVSLLEESNNAQGNKHSAVLKRNNKASQHTLLVERLGKHANKVHFTERVLGLVNEVNGLEPLFIIKLIARGRRVSFEPSLENVVRGVRDVFDNCFVYSNNISSVGNELFPLLGLECSCLQPLNRNDPTVATVYARLNRVLEDNNEAPLQVQEMYEEFEYLLQSDVDNVVHDAFNLEESWSHLRPHPYPRQQQEQEEIELEEEQRESAKQRYSLVELELVFERLVRDIIRITNRTPNLVKCELYAINCAEMKAVLTTKAKLLLSALTSTLAKHLSNQCLKVITQYETIYKRLSTDPTTPEELMELRNFVDSVPLQQEHIEHNFDAITRGYELLLTYQYFVPDTEYAQYWKGFGWPKKLQQFTEDRSFRCKEFRTIFMQELQNNCEKLSFQIIELAAHMEEFSHYGEDTRADEFYENAKELDKTLRSLFEAASLYNRHEELFGLPTSQYPQLKEIKTQFEPYYSLWEVASTFNAEVERWLSTRISSLQPAQIDQKIAEWSRQLMYITKKIKEAEPKEVARRLRESIESFKPNIPLLYALRSNLQPSHWRSIYQQCNIPRERQGFGPGGVDMNDSRSFSEFIKLGMLEHLNEIESIASVAQKTFELETELMGMEGEWKKLLFELEPYQDTYKLKSNDVMQMTLDEHIIKTQSMLSKPIVRQAPQLQARISQWSRQLDGIQCTMDAWFKCQNTWAYLEPIFTSADISRSLPKEKEMFVYVDASWHAIMDHTKSTPQILVRCQDETLHKNLADANDLLEQVLRKLQQFLETKRMAFPRFYFISNEELLQILSDSKDPFLVQPYLCKCFEGIKRIEFADHHDIISMNSAEGEKVELVKAVNPGDHANQVELWLQELENVMRLTIQDQLRQAILDYSNRKRTDFIRTWPGQVVIAVCCYYWTMECTNAMTNDGVIGLTTYFEKCASQLDDLILLVRDKELDVIERCTLEALVVIEVHSKDIVRMLSEKGVDSPTSFDWLSQLRYYWDDGNELTVNQINASLRYGYEYLGNTGRLVITPLTDRCYRTLIGALHLSYGGAPEGPAGTGKTETTKDLAKALGKYCVVYNCSDQISFKDMAKLFKGLTQAGAWGCFDEFNRIEIQVLSVIAQQVACIQEAIVQSMPEFIFDGGMIKLDRGCAIFITMNPGYAGRAELPDNLKALFRPVAMMVPNYAMIGEIQLYSYGFLHGKVLAEKIVATYRLCSEQLSSQDHYDYGMRAVKAVLTAAGRLKRQFPDEDEMILMLRSIEDVNLPKFLSQDVKLFEGIISDLFPGVALPTADYTHMHRALETVTARRNLQLTPYFSKKIYQTYEMICVRHGMMVVGYSFGGKTTSLHCLADALGEMELERRELRTRLVTINPKSVTLAQLYGRVEVSGEWMDGILSSRFRLLAQDTSPDRKWLVLDGPVDAVWIENMNTVLDDNKKLCLQNGDIIPMSKTMNLIFEVQDLSHASPATVSRCGMVYVEPAALGWRCLWQSYVHKLPALIANEVKFVDALNNLVDTFFDDTLEIVRKSVNTVIPQGASVAVSSFIKLFGSLIMRYITNSNNNNTSTNTSTNTNTNTLNKSSSFNSNKAVAGATKSSTSKPSRAESKKEVDDVAYTRAMIMRLEGWFIFSLVWSVGGCLFGDERVRFNAELQRILESKKENYKFSLSLISTTESYYDMYFDCDEEIHFIPWTSRIPEVQIADDSEYQDIIVPTTETVLYTYLINLMIEHAHPALLVGDTGTGKTVMIKTLLKKMDADRFNLNLIQFSAQTSANHLQHLIDAGCDKRRKGYYGPPINKRLIIFVDDTNLPQLEEYGAQPPIELLRQYFDHGGWYSNNKDGIEFRHLVDTLLLCAMGPAGGGRNPLSERFTRHFNTFSIPAFEEHTLKRIFGCLIDWILMHNFAPSLRGYGTLLVNATVELYTTLKDKLKPSPEKSHYTFNLRDVSKVFQGIDMTFAPAISDEVRMNELWVHEVSRAFADRFINEQDEDWFYEQVAQVSHKYMKTTVGAIKNNNSSNSNSGSTTTNTTTDKSFTLFASFTNDDGNYTPITNMQEARRILEDKVENFNIQTRGESLNLVVFDYVLQHVARIARVIRQPGGNLLLIGVGGSGRRSCTKLAAYIQECDYRTINVDKDYDHNSFLDDVRQVLINTGCKGYATAFIIADSQIVSEDFLEDICSLLNSAEVPGLWESKQDKENYDNAVAALRDVNRNMGRVDTNEALQSLFVERCKKFTHMVLCFSPLGNLLRERLRKFPSLVNCTTIDWFREWPENGLHAVAERFLGETNLSEQHRLTIVNLFVHFHQHIRDLCATYLAEARQYTYVTPTSYIELLKNFTRLLTSKQSELLASRQRYVSGLQQLQQTEEQVEVMQSELAHMKPELAQKQRETDELIATVERESKVAEAQRAMVAVDEASANEQAAAAKSMKDASQEKVDEAQPLVEQAQRAVLDLDPKALQEVKALKTPPQGVKYVIEVLCTLLGGPYKPKPIKDAMTGKVTTPYWEHAKTALLNAEFKNVLLTAYPDIVDNAPESQIEEVKRKMSNEMFTMENIRKTSVALIGVATYIKAVVEYYKQNKVIKPLLAQAAIAEREYQTAMAGLAVKKEELRLVNEKLEALTNHLDRVNSDKKALEVKVNDTDIKLTRARQLIEGLGGEKARFAQAAEKIAGDIDHVIGNVVISAGVVAYMGPYLRQYRKRIIEMWVKMCKDSGIDVDEHYSFTKFCGNPIDVQRWKLRQLPADGFSVQNAVIMQNSSRWPLLIDPQQQANNWIRSMERDNNLVVLRASEHDYLRALRDAIGKGQPVLLENLEEEIDSVLDNLLLKRVTREGAMQVIHLGEPVEWNPSFRFYMTTKLARPHYLPEVSTKVTLINFMITEAGLEDQLLQRVMMSERRDVEEKKQALTLEAAANQASLKETEDRILSILSSEGNILESENAIAELDRSKEQSDKIAKRQEEIDAMERISDRTRNLFVPVAHLGSILFFCVTELGNIDPMYQTSLNAYISIFEEALANSEKATEVSERIDNINSTFKLSLYRRICRSLFARDQLLFSFIMSLKVHSVDPTMLRWLLMAGFESNEGITANPFSWLPMQNWRLVCRASNQLSQFAMLREDVQEFVLFFQEFYESSNPLELDYPAELASKLTEFDKLVIVRCFRTDKIVPAVTQYVRHMLGDTFVEPSMYTLETVVDELNYDASVPIILVLSPGADPNTELMRVAEVKGISNSKLFKLSLGQGQEQPACELIDTGTREGHWVFLQNCHLHADFMPTLARIIEKYSDVVEKVNLHHDYRLWLTSLPSNTFPISILQNGVKLVQEPPKGLKNNLLQSYMSEPIADNSFFTSSNKAEIWQKLLFGLCFFHAVIQERRQYGPLGWNRPYEFNDTDRRISVRQVNMFINENEAVPYDALLYLVGQCNYGGRVTDDWDRRCLMATLETYFTPFILEDDYAFCDNASEYYAPAFGEYESYLEYIQSLPAQQPPCIFGLHENADITKDERDARILLTATLATQPRESSTTMTTSSANSNSHSVKLDAKTIVKQTAAKVLSRLPQLFDIEAIESRYPVEYSQSMNTVLLQEAIRYNRLLERVRSTLVNVQDAIDGKVVMSAELELVMISIYDGVVPEAWMRVSYPSLKPFGSYVDDLIRRLEFFEQWNCNGAPAMFWISGFYFTQSFLTGVLQNYARKHVVEIDKLTWKFTVHESDNFKEPPKEGCYIYGLFLEGAGWANGELCESKPKELFIAFPTIEFTPIKIEELDNGDIYHCPCYKTTDRRGVLSTTGHSTNFILTVDLPRNSDETENHWILRGTALFTQLEY